MGALFLKFVHLSLFQENETPSRWKGEGEIHTKKYQLANSTRIMSKMCVSSLVIWAIIMMIHSHFICESLAINFRKIRAHIRADRVSMMRFSHYFGILISLHLCFLFQNTYFRVCDKMRYFISSQYQTIGWHRGMKSLTIIEIVEW